MSVRVLIVDDEPLFQEVARDLIDATAGFRCVGAACSGEEGVDAAVRLRPDLVLIDVRMPGIGGIEAGRRISTRVDPPIVVFVSAEEGLAAVGSGVGADIVPKRRLTRALLKRLWEERSA